jgi:hypothetical protein
MGIVMQLDSNLVIVLAEISADNVNGFCRAAWQQCHTTLW